MPDKDTCCSFCGQKFITEGWPRNCQHCGNISYKNPIPVAVVLVPIGDGIVVIRRNTEPQKGTLTLPGGYIDTGESWQEGARRELEEETGIIVSADEIALYDVQNGLDDTLVIFGLANEQQAAQLRSFSSIETQEVTLIDQPIELGFTMHTDVVRRFFTERSDF